MDVNERGTRLTVCIESSWLQIANSVTPFSLLFLRNITGEAQNSDMFASDASGASHLGV